jgi:hypothetical protein
MDMAGFTFPEGELTDGFEIGGVSDRSVRVWLRSPGVPGPTVTLDVDGFAPVSITVPVSAEADWTGFADLTLPAPAPLARFTCMLGSERRTGTLAPSPGAPAPFSFAFGSCNRPYVTGSDGGLVRNPSVPIYDAMTAELAGEGAGFLLLVGDQIYSDEIEPISVRYALTGDATHPPPSETLLQNYRHISRGYLGFPGFRRLRESLPTLCIWDDHDIFDNWGSTLNPSPLDEAMFRAATQAYVEYQHTRNPGAVPGPPPFHYWFQYGTAGFFVTDVRGCRSYQDGLILGQAQWAALNGFLASDVAGQIDTLFIVSSIPISHTARWVGRLASNWKLRVADSVRDRWTANAFVDDRNRVLRRLFGWQIERPARQVVVLSGDVHVASSMTVRERHGTGVIEQFTSSAMTTPVETVHVFLHRIVTRGLNLLEPDFAFQRHFICVDNNYGFVRLTPLPSGGHEVDFVVRGWDPVAGNLRTLARRSCRPTH